MSTFERYREDALKALKIAEARYGGEEWARVPLNYARRWADAFRGQEADLDAVSDIVRDAEREPGHYDIFFHAGVNTMRRIRHELWEELLTRRLGE